MKKKVASMRKHYFLSPSFLFFQPPQPFFRPFIHPFVPHFYASALGTPFKFFFLKKKKIYPCLAFDRERGGNRRRWWGKNEGGNFDYATTLLLNEIPHTRERKKKVEKLHKKWKRRQKKKEKLIFIFKFLKDFLFRLIHLYLCLSLSLSRSHSFSLSSLPSFSPALIFPVFIIYI